MTYNNSTIEQKSHKDLAIEQLIEFINANKTFITKIEGNSTYNYPSLITIKFDFSTRKR